MINPKKLIQYTLLTALAIILSACGEEDEEPAITNTPTESAIVNPIVGGASQPNQVFVDLSTETQTAVHRSSWDFGFYNGSEFRVIINNASSALATPFLATDLNAVSAADTLGMGARLDVDAIFGTLQGPPATWLAEAASWMDDPSGDLSKTAIGEVSVTDSNNPVYIVNRGKNPDGTSRGWVKIRVLRSGSDYTLQYADIDATSFNELTISKNNDFNFTYASLDNGLTTVEPESDSWDIAFTTFTSLLPIGQGITIPYQFKDYVIQNRNDVTTASVAADAATTYDNFGLSNIATLTFSSEITGIGSSWRTVAQPGSPVQTGVNQDLFYVIKDGADNYYKLRFTRMLDPVSGERGFPQIQYDLLNE